MLFDDGDILRRSLVIEVESLFCGCLLVEVAVDGDEEAGLSGG
jgi:hypothetical protein